MGGRVRSRSWRGRSREVGVLYQVKKYFYYFTLLYPRELYPLPGIQFSGSVRSGTPRFYTQNYNLSQLCNTHNTRLYVILYVWNVRTGHGRGAGAGGCRCGLCAKG